MKRHVLEKSALFANYNEQLPNAKMNHHTLNNASMSNDDSSMT